MKKNEELKLKQDETVLYWDGSSFMELTIVKTVDKEKGEAVLANGVKVSRTSKVNDFKRVDYLSVKGAFTGFVKKLGKEEQALYDAWIFRVKFLKEIEVIKSKLTLRTNELRALALNGQNLEYIQEISNKFKDIIK